MAQAPLGRKASLAPVGPQPGSSGTPAPAQPSTYTDSDLSNADYLKKYLSRRANLVSDPGDDRLMNITGRNLDRNYITSLEQQLRNRSSQRQGLLNAESTVEGLKGDEQELLKNEAAQALKSGVKNTRQNFNQRGMLFSGMRQSGEQDVRSRVASQLAGQTTETNRDYNQLLEGYQGARASLGLRNAAEQQQRAEAVLDQTMRNRVARLQSMQALGRGVGYAAGSIYGSGGEPSTGDETREIGGGQFMSNRMGL